MGQVSYGPGNSLADQPTIDTIVRRTTSNYQVRYADFSRWAEEAENAEPAKHCRGMLLENVRRWRNGSSAARPIKILDAGCGPCRDVAGFEQADGVECTGFDPCVSSCRLAPTVV